MVDNTRKRKSIGEHTTDEMKVSLNYSPKVARTIAVNDMIKDSLTSNNNANPNNKGTGENNSIKDLQNQVVTCLKQLLLDSHLTKVSEVMIIIHKMTNLLYEENKISCNTDQNNDSVTFFSLLLSSALKSSVLALALASSDEWLLIIRNWIYELTLPSIPCPDQTTEQGQILSMIFNILDILPLPYPVLTPSDSCIKLNHILHLLQTRHPNQWTSKLATGMFLPLFYCSYYIC